MSAVFRPPDGVELAVFERLLAVDFKGVQALRTQLPGLSLRQIDSENSFELKVVNEIRAIVATNPPVEATYPDKCDEDQSSGKVHIRLHVHNGLMNELEIFKDDGSTILRQPKPDELSVQVNKPPS